MQCLSFQPVQLCNSISEAHYLSYGGVIFHCCNNFRGSLHSSLKQNSNLIQQAYLKFVKKNYTSRFLGQKFHTLKVRKLRLFLLKKKQRKCVNISYFSSFFCQNLTVCVNFYRTRVRSLVMLVSDSLPNSLTH